MTVADAIKYLQELPPYDVAPMSYMLAPRGLEGSPRIAMGRVEIKFDPDLKLHGQPVAFYVGRDATITVDGKPLDVGLLSEIRVIVRRNEPVVVELAVLPQPDRKTGPDAAAA